MEKFFHKYVSTFAFVFTAVVYALEQSWTTVIGLAIGLAMMVMDAIVFTIIYKSKKQELMRDEIDKALTIMRHKVDNSLSVTSGNDKRIEILETKLSDQNKTIESLRTALNMKQLGR